MISDRSNLKKVSLIGLCRAYACKKEKMAKKYSKLEQKFGHFVWLLSFDEFFVNFFHTQKIKTNWLKISVFSILDLKLKLFQVKCVPKRFISIFVLDFWSKLSAILLFLSFDEFFREFYLTQKNVNKLSKITWECILNT